MKINSTMNNRDINAAARALYDWFASQEIDPEDSLLVMATAIAGVVDGISKSKQQRIKGGEIVASMILDMIKAS